MSRSSRTLPGYWDSYKPDKDSDSPAPAVDSFEWTQYPGHGEGEGILQQPRSALDLGCGEGKEAVYLARKGVEVIALDFSPVQVARARRWWGDTPGLSFVEADACQYLATTRSTYDAIYSIWGAAWFTDPERLFPLVAQRLNPGGVFAFSQAEPLEGFHGFEGLYGNGFTGRKLTVRRWSYSPEAWADLLKRHGFHDIEARVLEAPDPDDVGTLMVCAR
ncbi:class I SAM-dependent methyltransferase [Wenjunlia tyrosinilytica]|uniref:Methyltransferase type 11 domain-containing protein n=1 Tax=Wenjunlia tyrosinilytica TaxID=1544741 RepID=A0A917ZL73_9ACTN|nr:class I SAM-dependent methyltransferase [Wenjunlia tyrosinilytica]GGO85017.1 hypothetical protein GCM10012280_17830 [Wenjunlia tyrosinilytica]